MTEFAVETARSSQLYNVRLLSRLRGQANCTMSDCCRDCEVKPTVRCQTDAETVM